MKLIDWILGRYKGFRFCRKMILVLFVVFVYKICINRNKVVLEGICEKLSFFLKCIFEIVKMRMQGLLFKKFSDIDRIQLCGRCQNQVFLCYVFFLVLGEVLLEGIIFIRIVVCKYVFWFGDLDGMKLFIFLLKIY